jgi:hypothetical protein
MVIGTRVRIGAIVRVIEPNAYVVLPVLRNAFLATGVRQSGDLATGYMATVDPQARTRPMPIAGLAKHSAALKASRLCVKTDHICQRESDQQNNFEY